MVFDGKAAAAKILESLSAESAKMRVKYGRVACLSVVLVGEDYGSMRYVASCEKNAQRAGLSCRVVAAIAPEKDVDGVTDTNVSRLWKAKRNDYSQYSVPCTPRSVMRILEEAKIDLDGKQAVVLGRSNIVGMPVSKLLLNENATVTICHSHTQDLAAIVRSADVVVAAIGKAKFVGAEMVKEGEEKILEASKITGVPLVANCVMEGVEIPDGMLANTELFRMSRRIHYAY